MLDIILITLYTTYFNPINPGSGYHYQYLAGEETETQEALNSLTQNHTNGYFEEPAFDLR